MNLTENNLLWLGDIENKYLFCVMYKDEEYMNSIFIDDYDDAITYYNTKNTKNNYIKLYKIGEQYYNTILKN
jgi:hypothetical protein